jgi:hypothetical protein
MLLTQQQQQQRHIFSRKSADITVRFSPNLVVINRLSYGPSSSVALKSVQWE